MLHVALLCNMLLVCASKYRIVQVLQKYIGIAHNQTELKSYISSKFVLISLATGIGQ